MALWDNRVKNTKSTQSIHWYQQGHNKRLLCQYAHSLWRVLFDGYMTVATQNDSKCNVTFDNLFVSLVGILLCHTESLILTYWQNSVLWETSIDILWTWQKQHWTRRRNNTHAWRAICSSSVAWIRIVVKVLAFNDFRLMVATSAGKIFIVFC